MFGNQILTPNIAAVGGVVPMGTGNGFNEN